MPTPPRKRRYKPESERCRFTIKFAETFKTEWEVVPGSSGDEKLRFLLDVYNTQKDQELGQFVITPSASQFLSVALSQGSSEIENDSSFNLFDTFMNVFTPESDPRTETSFLAPDHSSISDSIEATVSDSSLSGTLLNTPTPSSPIHNSTLPLSSTRCTILDSTTTTPVSGSLLPSGSSQSGTTNASGGKSTESSLNNLKKTALYERRNKDVYTIQTEIGALLPKLHCTNVKWSFELDFPGLPKPKIVGSESHIDLTDVQLLQAQICRIAKLQNELLLSDAAVHELLGYKDGINFPAKGNKIQEFQQLLRDHLAEDIPVIPLSAFINLNQVRGAVVDVPKLLQFIAEHHPTIKFPANGFVRLLISADGRNSSKSSQFTLVTMTILPNPDCKSEVENYADLGRIFTGLYWINGNWRIIFMYESPIARVTTLFRIC